jgi:serine/threonine protein kinase
MHELSVGSVFAGHRIEEVAGKGGMGVVYRVRNEILGQERALKVVTGELARDETFRARFRREARLAAALKHPNLIPIFHAGEEAGVLYMVMEFVEGVDLASVIERDGRLDPDRALALLGQVASALDAANAHGMVHRDVKPSNVLIRGEGKEDHAYLTDFGLTKRTASESALTLAGDFLGTPQYAAPEQIGDGKVGPRSDVYSLGCVLFVALTGQVPFPAAEVHVALFAHLSRQPPRATEVAPDLPPAIDAVIARALAKNPDERFASGSELMQQAVRVLSARPRAPAPTADAEATRPSTADQGSTTARASRSEMESPTQTPEQRALAAYRDLVHLRPGDHFGPYDITGLAGHGEVGVVYRAVELSRYRPVALKVLHPALSETTAARDRLLRASRIVRELDHPHVVPVYDSGEIDGRLFAAMLYVPGTDLKRLIGEQGRLGPEMAIRLVTQIALGLDAAAKRGLCHLDLKPTNVLVAGEPTLPRALVCDFGRDPLADAAHRDTAVLRPITSLDYVAPERFAGEADTQAIAVYALGCVLFEALSGDPPFADTPAGLEAKRAAHEKREPDVGRPGIPPELRAAVSRALSKRPADRFRTAGELAAAAKSALVAGDAQPPSGE